MGNFIVDDEAINKVEKVNILSDYNDLCSTLDDNNTTEDKCSGHCISDQPGTLGHHDNRSPLY
jgi:hypothetical protein